MLPKAHLSSHSRMSGYRWVITALCLSGSWRSLLYNSSVYSYHFLLISSASVRSIPFLSFIEPIFAWCSLVISNVLEEISSLSHSVVLYFFALITEEGFVTSPCYSLELSIQMDISFLFSFAFSFSSFSALWKASSDNHFAFLHFFSWRWSWPLPPVQCHWTSIYSSSNILSIRSNPVNVFLTLAHSEKKSENKEHMLMQVSPKTQFLLWPLEGFKDQNIGKLRN